MAELLGDKFDDDLTDETRFSRTRYASDARERTQRKLHVEVRDIVTRNALQLEPSDRCARRVQNCSRRREEILRCKRRRYVTEILQRSAVEHFAALFPRGRTNINYPIGLPNHVNFVFNNE